ncbi:PspC domain-containing protein [Plantactinospora sp. CA-290183]|uniref:PspC domain-containing protein n=1 Tax=Plantactinospora sp. CA-290183 TaxID=3240006 RepID=UPI003D9067AE
MTDEAAARGPADPTGPATPAPADGPPGPSGRTGPDGEEARDRSDPTPRTAPTDPWPEPGAPPPPGPGTSPPPGPGNPPPSGQWAGPGGPPPGFRFTSRYGLVRPAQGRYLAGVCAAIGRATNTDPILWRVILAVLGFFGGIGILVYVAAWLTIPAEGDTASPVESMLGRGRSSMSPATVLILGILFAVIFGFIVTDAFRAALLGVAILIVGALLVNRESSRTGAGRQPAGGAPPTSAFPTMPHPQFGGPGPYQPGYPPPAPHRPFAEPGYPPGGPVHPAWGAGGPGYPTSGPGAAPSGPGQPAPGQPWQPAGAATGHGTWYPPTAPAPAGPGYLAPPPPSPAWATGPAPAAPPAVTRPDLPTAPGGYRPPFAPHGPYAAAEARLAPPPARPPKPPKPPRERSRLGSATFSMIFVAVGLVAILDLTNLVRVWPSTYFAGVLVTIALGLLVGTWFGRARWLIALGLVAALALGISSLAESWHRVQDDGPVTWAPASYEALADRYETRFGDATLDLSGVDFTNRDADISAAVNVGELTVILPPDVDVTTRVDIRAGDARVLGNTWSGVDSRNREVVDLGDDGAGGGRLRLTLTVDAGVVEVVR